MNSKIMKAKSQGNLNYALMLPFLTLTNGMQFSYFPPPPSLFPSHPSPKDSLKLLCI